jgi:ribose transport system substrate-binding protein
MIKRTWIPLAWLGGLSLLAAGCGSGTDSSSTSTTTTGSGPSASADANKPLELAFVTNGASDFWKIAQAGTEKAASELKGVTVDFKIPPNGTPDEQKQIIDGLLVKGVNGIAISVSDPANQTQYLKSDVAPKTLLITQDSDAADSDRKCYIGTDNEAAGKQAGEALKKALPNGGKVRLFVGVMDAENAKDRVKGIKEAIAGTKIEIVGDPVTDNKDKQKAIANVSDVLTTTPDIAGLVGIWSYNGPAILNAVKQANKVGKVKIVAFDEEDDTLNGIASGAIEATVVQQPFEFGYEAVTNMTKYLRGDTSIFPANKLVYVPTKVIDKASVAEFKAQLYKQLGKS